MYDKSEAQAETQGQVNRPFWGVFPFADCATTWGWFPARNWVFSCYNPMESNARILGHQGEVLRGISCMDCMCPPALVGVGAPLTSFNRTGLSKTVGRCHMCASRLEGECKGSIHQLLCLRRESCWSTTPLADALKLASESPSHIV